MIKVGDIVRHRYLNGVFRVAEVSNLNATTFEVSTGNKKTFYIDHLNKLNKYSIGDTVGKYNIKTVDYNCDVEYVCFDTIMNCILKQYELEDYEQNYKRENRDKNISIELEKYGITWGGNTIISIPLKNIGAYTVPNIKKVIFSDPATIVIWEDDTKTIVKAGKNDKGKKEKFDPEKGLTMAICKKLYGTNASGSNYYDVLKKWLEE